MLTSTLERKCPKIILDAVMQNGAVTRHLEEINKECYEYYTKVFSKRKASFDKLTLNEKENMNSGQILMQIFMRILQKFFQLKN